MWRESEGQSQKQKWLITGKRGEEWATGVPGLEAALLICPDACLLPTGSLATVPCSQLHHPMRMKGLCLQVAPGIPLFLIIHRPSLLFPILSG